MLGHAKSGWIRSCSRRMDRALRQELMKLYQPMRRFPCFLHKWLDGRIRRRKRIPVIIEFHNHQDSFTMGMQQMEEQLKSFKRCRIGHHYPELYSCSAELTPDSIEELLKPDCQTRIKRMYHDCQYTIQLNQARPSVHLDSLQTTGLTGSGVTVAVLDTGIYPHPDLTQPTSRIAAFKDYINGRTSPYDDNGHGTHVAGCIAGNGSSSQGTYRGTAPGARLVGVKVLNREGSGSLSGILAGIQWCMANKETYGIRILNLSLGSPAMARAQDDPLVQAVEAAWRAGITVLAAAGNEGPDPGTISSPGTSPLIITVGAMNDFNTPERTDDKAADFSSRGPTVDGLVKPDLLVPGVNIISLRSPSSYIDRTQKYGRVGSDYFSMSGTSMATPICTGIAALLLQRTPSLTPDDVKRELLEGAVNWGLSPYVQGRGYLDARKALDL